MKPWGIVCAAIGIAAAPAPALAELKTFVLSWSAPGGGAARGSLTIDDAVCNNPGVNTFGGGPEGCFVALAFTVSGDIRGKGTYTLDDMQDINLQTGVALDYDAELIAQGPTELNFFGNGNGPGGIAPFVMAAGGAQPEDHLTLNSATPLPLPLAKDAAKCSGAVAKAGGAYFAARHKALHACQSGLVKGTALFADKAKTVPVSIASECALEFKAAGKIAKARARLRGSLAKKCSDSVLAGIPACAPTVDLLADPVAGTGCVLESVDFNVEKLIHAEFGL